MSKKGRLNVPRGLIKRLGLEGGETMIVEVDEEGAAASRPTGVHPINAPSKG